MLENGNNEHSIKYIVSIFDMAQTKVFRHNCLGDRGGKFLDGQGGH
jgi:hypothetical protein